MQLAWFAVLAYSSAQDVFLASSDPGANACATNLDCSLAGLCNASGQCECRPWATGPNCEALNLVPVASVEALVPEDGVTRWGASVVRGDDGKYHMFAAEMKNKCKLNSWRSLSQVIHAVAEDPLGPYERLGVAVNTESHNPVVSRAPDGTYVMLTIGCPAPYSGTDCQPPEVICPNGQEARWTTTLHHSTSVEGPWTELPGLFDHLGLVQNAVPWFEADGSVSVIYKGPVNNTEASIAVAPHWSGPYTSLAENIWKDWELGITNEDPWIWRDDLGYHAVTHRMLPDDRGDHHTGGHGFAATLEDWHYAPTPAYSNDVNGIEGDITVKRRERPQLLLVDGQPRALYNAIMVADGSCFSFAQELAH